MPVDNNEPKIDFDALQASSGSKRRRQLFLALTLLLMALVLVVARNWQFWLSALSLEEATNQATPDTGKKDEAMARPARLRKAGAKQTPPARAQEHSEVTPEPGETTLAPLRVDVTYASGQHRTLMARNSAVHVDLEHNSQQSVDIPERSAMSSAGTETAGGGQVRFSPQTAEVVVRRVEPVYPLLAQQENVQGAVVLQARIDKDGNVQSLQVLSGPAILTAAALEAVKQWRFKPHYESDRATPVETRITVNFTITAQ
jgi:TonB family protein